MLERMTTAVRADRGAVPAPPRASSLAAGTAGGGWPGAGGGPPEEPAAPALDWQRSLLDDGAVRPDPGFCGLRRHRLDATAWVEHVPGWLAGSEQLFEELLATGRWRQREREMYGRMLPEPRLTAWFPWEPDSGVPLPPVLEDVRAVLSTRYRVTFDSVLVNLYRDGRDSVAWHRDRVHRVLAEPMVATVSLGARRRFLLRPRGGGASLLSLDLGAGDLVVMGGTCQQGFEHTVPKVAAAGPRMSVTIRHSQVPSR